MKIFHQILGNSLVAGATNFFVWGGIIYWAYLGTESVLATSISSGIYLITVAFSGFWFGSIVDHHKKKTAMLVSSIATLLMFGIGLAIFSFAPEGSLSSVSSLPFWLVILAVLFGVIAGNIRNIALPTMVTMLVPEDQRDRANGMSGTVFGISFALSNVAAGFGIGFLGLFWVLVIAMGLTLLTIIHLLFIKIPEPDRMVVQPENNEKQPGKIDIKGTISVVKTIPGLFPLIFFTTFNNFLGGVFMSLMDAYGLTLVSVQVWGSLWGFLSLGFIVGGIYISKKGVGKNPVKTIFTVNSILWTVCIFMTIQPSIVLIAVSMFIYLCLMPFIESSEQTVIQRVVPFERQGRVFGFAQSIEQAASPVTAFMIGPIAQFIFIPFMTTGAGVELIGEWYGVGKGRGIGLVFSIAGLVGLIVTIIAARSRSAKKLSAGFEQAKPTPTP